MALLASAAYDPAAAVSKSTASLLAMTALDTTNLRLTFTVPTSGIVLVRLKGQVAGSATTPRILLGVLEGATVRGRVAPIGQIQVGAAGMTAQEAVYLVSGLTPGASLTWDAAYAVQVVTASTNLKYGGPNDTAGNDAWGAFQFEVWETVNLLAGKLYDPAVAVSKSTASLLAMTALDTTNLRLTFNAPASGNVLWRVRAQQAGSTGFNQILLGILESATVLARTAAVIANPNVAAATTSCYAQEASGVITEVSAGSHTYDAAYAVQATGNQALKYGGPDDASGNDAFGGIAFELWAA